jgi:hypothetical protein
MPRILSQAELNNLTSEEKVVIIRKYNKEQDLPKENPALTLYNGSLLDAHYYINFKVFLICAYEFTHPLSAYPQNEQYEHLAKYAGTLSRINEPRVSFAGISGKTPGLLTVSIVTHEISLQGYWIEIHRTVHLHQAEPFVSIDIIGDSNVVASPDPDNCLCPPRGIYYHLPLDLRDPF